MKKTILITAAIIFFLAAICYGANTTTKGAGTIKIVPDGTNDWYYNVATDGGFSNTPGMKIYSIQFNPSAANDRLILHNGGLDAIEIFDSNPSAGTAPIIKYYPGGKYIRLVFDASDCTFSTPSSASIYIEYEAQ